MVYKNTIGKGLLLLLMNLLWVSPNWGQDLASVTAAYNEAIQKANEDPTTTQTTLTALLPQLEALGDEGADIKGKIEGVLPSLQYKSALTAYKAKDIKTAIAGFEKALVLSEKYNNTDVPNQVKPKLPTVYYSQGRSLLKAKDSAGADASFDKALAIDENYAKAYYGKSMVQRTASSEKMFEYLEKAIELAGDNTKSVTSFKKGTKIHLYKQAKSLVKSKKYSQGIEMLNKAISYDYEGSKDGDKIYVQLGKAYAGLNKKSDACAAYSKVKGEKYIKVAKYEMEQTLKCK